MAVIAIAKLPVRTSIRPLTNCAHFIFLKHIFITVDSRVEEACFDFASRCIQKIDGKDLAIVRALTPRPYLRLCGDTGLGNPSVLTR